MLREQSAGKVQVSLRVTGGLFARAVLTAAMCWAPWVTAAGAAQTATNASIIGQVTDESGAVLPGVVVTATSPSLQVREVSSVSDDRGEYRLMTLPLACRDRFGSGPATSWMCGSIRSMR